MDWGELVVQVTALVGGLAAIIAILNGVYELRERRQKERAKRPSSEASIPPPDSPSTEPSPGEAPATGPAPAAPRRLSNLPSLPTGLIGREEELAELELLLLRPGVRLVTLTGPAGVGKTRLALQAASNVLEHFADGAFFVPLAPVADPDLVVPTIARVLDVREQGSKPLLELLKDQLQDKKLLLLLDNFEQVMPAAGDVAELVAAAPQLSIMVTSREVLHLYGEHAFVVPPLELPDLEGLPPEALLAEVSHNEAVRLFVARAESADSAFTLTGDNAPPVAEIVNRLDGLPLAIELAAARIRLLPPEAMLRRLEEATGGASLQLLTSGARDLPARQQTLRNTVAWSYELLDEGEQALFQRLGVFSGGWTLEAAEVVGTAGRENAVQAGPSGVLEVLESLVSKSLIAQAPRRNRFMMLRTIRDYALEELEKAGIAGVVRQAHAEWCTSFVEQAEPQLYGQGQVAALQWLDAEQDNLRAAMQWALEGQHGELALRLAGRLAWYWNLRGRVTEGRSWLEAALAVPARDGQKARAAALNGLAELVSNQGDWTVAWSALQECVTLARGLGDRRLLARSLATLSLFRVRGARGNIREDQALVEESLALSRALGESWTLGYVLTVLDIRNILLGDHSHGSALGEEALHNFEFAGDQWGVVLSLRHLGMGAFARGDYSSARHFGERALAVSRELGDRLGEAYTLSTLGDIARIEGDYERAAAYYDEGLTLYRDLGLKGDVAATLHNLGYVALARHDTQRAMRLQTESLDMHTQAGNKVGMVEAVTGLAAVARATGDLERAARLFAAVDGLRSSMAAPLWPAERTEYDRHVAALRGELDETAASEAWADGRSLTLEQAVAEALELAPAVPAQAKGT